MKFAGLLHKNVIYIFLQNTSAKRKRNPYSIEEILKRPEKKKPYIHYETIEKVRPIKFNDTSDDEESKIEVCD